MRAGTAPRPDLVIWPENSTDIDPYRNADANAVITAAAARHRRARSWWAPSCRPTLRARGTTRRIVWDPVTGPGEIYNKRHPCRSASTCRTGRSSGSSPTRSTCSAGTFLPGDRPGNLDVAGVNVGDVICFEVVYDDLVRDVVTGGAQVLVVQTNNATFGYTNETYQQQAMSRVRAVEHGRGGADRRRPAGCPR